MDYVKVDFDIATEPEQGEISISHELRLFAETNKLTIPTMKCLISNGFRDVSDIVLLRESEIRELDLLLAQKCRLRNAIEVEQQKQEAPASNKVSSVIPASKEPQPGRDIRITDGQLELNGLIGEGYFGAVHKATLHNNGPNKPLQLAAKTISEKFKEQDTIEFLQETHSMVHLNHRNIIEVIGVMEHVGASYVLLEYMSKGNLRDHIANPKESFILNELLGFGLQIADGMKYLTEKNCIHGNLAARNCLLSATDKVKLSDFGLAHRVLNMEHLSKGHCPIKWMAIEVITKGLHTPKSDVWSFGVVLWELLTRGRKPYEGHINVVVIDMIKHGRRLEKPEAAIGTIYTTMEECWNANPEMRPSFDKLQDWLKKLVAEFQYTELTFEPDMYLTTDGVKDSNDGRFSIPAPQPKKRTPLPPRPKPRNQIACADAGQEDLDYIVYGPGSTSKETNPVPVSANEKLASDKLMELILGLSKEHLFAIFERDDVSKWNRIATGYSHMKSMLGRVSYSDDTYETEIIIQEPLNEHKLPYAVNTLKLLATLDHENITTLLGVSMIENVPNIILKKMTLLHDYIRMTALDGVFITNSDLASYSYDVACGLEYLHLHGIVLADGPTTRTCWLDYGHAVIGGFAVAHDVTECPEIDFSKARFPTKWMSVEWHRGASQNYKYTFAGDMWTFGIFLWELISKGKLPYSELEAKTDAGKAICDGYRMEHPVDSPPEINSIISRCWHESMEERPTIAESCRLLRQITTHPDENEYAAMGDICRVKNEYDHLPKPRKSKWRLPRF